MCFLYSAWLPGLQVPGWQRRVGLGIGMVPWPGGRQEWRKWRALFYLEGGEGAKTETRESLADLKGTGEFPWVMSPQISPGIVSLQVEWFFVCLFVFMEDVLSQQERSHFLNVLEKCERFI